MTLYVSSWISIKTSLGNKYEVGAKKNKKVFVGVKIVHTFAVLLKRRTALFRREQKRKKNELVSVGCEISKALRTT